MLDRQYFTDHYNDHSIVRFLLEDKELKKNVERILKRTHDNESMLAILSDTFSKGYAAALSDMEKTIKMDPG